MNDSPSFVKAKQKLLMVLIILMLTSQSFVAVAQVSPTSISTVQIQTKEDSSEAYTDVVGDFRPAAGKVITYVNYEGNRVIRQEMIWTADRIAAIQAAYGSLFSSAVTYEHGFSFNTTGAQFPPGVWVNTATVAGIPVAQWAQSNLPEWYIDTAVLPEVDNEFEVTFGTANAKKLEANKLYYTEIALLPGEVDLDNAKLTADLGYHFVPCGFDQIPPFCIADRHHWTIIPAWEILVPGETSWNTEGFGSIGGRVYRDGQPSGAASIEVLMREDVIARGKTDINGYFEIQNIPAQLKVKVRATAYNIDGTSVTGFFNDLTQDSLNQDAITVKANQTHVANVFIGAFQCGGVQSSNAFASSADCAPPLASGFSVAINQGVANLAVSGVQDTDSGIKELRYSAKWNGTWRNLATVSTAPYSYSWNMCAWNVPDGSVEFGLEIWDKVGNNFVWSQHNLNPVKTKSFNCNPSNDTSTGYAKLYAQANYGGSVQWSGGLGFSNSPNANSYALQLPSGWSARTWRGDNKGGEQRCWDQSVPNLQDHGWHNSIQSIETFNRNDCGTGGSGLIVMCSPTGCWQFGTGYHSMPAFGPGWNDTMTRLTEVPSGMSVSIYREGSKRGTVECYNAPRDPLPSGWPSDLYAQVTDIEVFNQGDCPNTLRTSVVFHNDSNFQSYTWSAGADPGVYNMENLGSKDYFNDTAQSVRFPVGKSGILYEHNEAQGERSECLSGDIPNIGSLNNRTSSIEIFGNATCAPLSPYNLRVSGVTEDSISLAWDHATPNTVGFRVYKWNGNEFVFLSHNTPNRSFTDQVQCGTQQFYKVSSTNAFGESGQVGWVMGQTSACTAFAPALPEPELTGMNVFDEDAQIYIAWRAAERANDYKADLLGEKTYSSGWKSQTSWLVTGVEPGLYILQVSARNEVGEVKTGLTFVGVRIAIPVITAIDSPTCSSLTITWNDYSNFEEKFYVLRDEQVIAEVASIVGKSSYSFTDEGRAEGSQHTYRVVAKLLNTEDEKDFLNGKSGSVTGLVRSCHQQPTIPEWTRNVRTAGHTDTTIQVLWDDSSDNESGFIVWQHMGAGYQEIARVGVGVTSFTVANLVCQTEYHFAVSAFNEAGQSELNGSPGSTTQCQVDPPPPPQNMLFLPLVQR